LWLSGYLFIQADNAISPLWKGTSMATTAPDPVALVKQGSKWGIIWGVLLVILGMAAIAEPFLAAIALATFIAWLLIFVGIVHIVLAFHAHIGTSLGWKVLIGISYIFIGGYLLFRPVVGVATLTLMLAFLFLIEGVLDFMLWWKARSADGAFWILLDSLITLVLGGMIYVGWPSSSAWAIGTLVGISMIISGATRVMLSLAVRRVANLLA
jgi:uncharacterized membrane protein HdeD (DUF308 family)